ncbi:MAG: DUF1684 domain-containing protein [Actinomycetota bacterium]
MTPSNAFTLLDWRRRIFDLYGRIRGYQELDAAWAVWRSTRDELFARHPQTPLSSEARAAFRGLEYFDYDPNARVVADVLPVGPEHLEIGTSDGSAYGFTRFADAHFFVHGSELTLALYWLDGYGGGLFLPFRDLTAGAETYGAGRYLLDTVKGADLGSKGDRLVLDFNFAYNPSCAYDPRWVCPLAPPANRLDVSIRAGERAFS